MLFGDVRGINAWTVEFMRQQNPLIFVSDRELIPRLAHYFWKYHLNPLAYRITLSERTLSARADILLNFSGRPFLDRNRMPKHFPGLKVTHTMDYTGFPEQSHRALQEDGVDLLLGYARHDLYCPLFQKYYPSYLGKVIAVPFGFHPRFVSTVPFEQRENKCVALGAVNSFNDPIHNVDEFRETNEFFLARGEKFMHKFRRMLAENERPLADLMASRLPDYPVTKNFSYDIVEAFNRYKMFVSCESLQYFPPAKTFEGPAAGSVLVCSDHPCYTALGFEDGVNCVRHREFDVQNFREKISSVLTGTGGVRLEAIQRAGSALVHERFSHAAIAQALYRDLETRRT